MDPGIGGSRWGNRRDRRDIAAHVVVQVHTYVLLHDTSLSSGKVVSLVGILDHLFELSCFDLRSANGLSLRSQELSSFSTKSYYLILQDISSHCKPHNGKPHFPNPFKRRHLFLYLSTPSTIIYHPSVVSTHISSDPDVYAKHRPDLTCESSYRDT